MRTGFRWGWKKIQRAKRTEKYISESEAIRRGVQAQGEPVRWLISPPNYERQPETTMAHGN